MNGFFETSAFFGVFISLLFYGIGMTVKKKLKLAVFNPLLIAIVLTILFLAVTGIDYSVYEKGAKHISFLLTPATICLAVPLYEQLRLLKENLMAVVMGQSGEHLFAGVNVSAGSRVLCDPFAQVYHYGHRYRGIGRAGRVCAGDRGIHHCNRGHRQYVRGGSVPDLQDP